MKIYLSGLAYLLVASLGLLQPLTANAQGGNPAVAGGEDTSAFERALVSSYWGYSNGAKFQFHQDGTVRRVSGKIGRLGGAHWSIEAPLTVKLVSKDGRTTLWTIDKTFSHFQGKSFVGTDLQADRGGLIGKDPANDTADSNVPAAPPEKVAPSVAPSPAPEKTLTLSRTWTLPFKTDACTSELGGLLSDQTQAALDLKAHDSLAIFQEVTYLMPQQKAEDLFKKHLAVSVQLHCSAFPKDSFSYSSIDGAFFCPLKGPFFCGVEKENKRGGPRRANNRLERFAPNAVQYDTLALVTDYTKQVVAVELIEENPKGEPWLSDECYSDSYKIYDFVESGSKSLSKMAVGHWVEGGDVIKIYSELLDKPTRKLKKRVLLLLPKPVANVVLYNLQHYQE